MVTSTVTNSIHGSTQLPEDFEVAYAQLQGEIEVGGVFLRLFIQQPNWVSAWPSYSL